MYTYIKYLMIEISVKSLWKWKFLVSSKALISTLEFQKSSNNQKFLKFQIKYFPNYIF